MTGRENALETIMNLGGLSRRDAEIVLDKYLQLRIATYDSVGQVQYSHGHFLDREILQRAVVTEIPSSVKPLTEKKTQKESRSKKPWQLSVIVRGVFPDQTEPTTQQKAMIVGSAQAKTKNKAVEVARAQINRAGFDLVDVIGIYQGYQ
jgi:hypothetical protein